MSGDYHFFPNAETVGLLGLGTIITIVATTSGLVTYKENNNKQWGRGDVTVHKQAMTAGFKASTRVLKGGAILFGLYYLCKGVRNQ